MAWVDIAIIVIVLLYAIIGLSRGFLKSLLNFFGTLATLALSILLAKPVSGLLNNWFGLSDKLGDWISGSLAPYCVSSSNGAIDNFFMDKFATLLMGSNYWQNYEGGVSSDAFISAFSESVGSILCVIIAVFALYIIIRIVIALLGKLFKFLTRNRAIGGIDRFFGLVLGLVQGACVIFIILGIIYLIAPAIPALSDQLIGFLETNPLTRELYEIMGDFIDGILIPWLGI